MFADAADYLYSQIEHFSCSHEYLSIEVSPNPQADMSLFWVQLKKRLIQPDLKHRNVDFIVSFGLLDEQMRFTLPRLLRIVFPRICFAFHA